MFCPNCAAQNDVAQHYCRTCGLKLDVIAEDLSSQRPSEAFASLLQRKRQLELLGVACLSIAGVIGLFIVAAAVFYYKMQWIAPELLFGFASIALVLFTILSALFLSYPKFMKRLAQSNPRPPDPEKKELEAVTTQKLIEEKPIEPIQSVTEDSTELLPIRNRTNR